MEVYGFSGNDHLISYSILAHLSQTCSALSALLQIFSSVSRSFVRWLAVRATLHFKRVFDLKALALHGALRDCDIFWQRSDSRIPMIIHMHSDKSKIEIYLATPLDPVYYSLMYSRSKHLANVIRGESYSPKSLSFMRREHLVCKQVSPYVRGVGRDHLGIHQATCGVVRSDICVKL